MSEETEVKNVIDLAQRLVGNNETSNHYSVMSWFEKAAQVLTRYEMELKPQDRMYIVMLLEATWGGRPLTAPSLTPPDDKLGVPAYVEWIMKHIMYLTHPDNDALTNRLELVFFIMNECRQYLDMPKITQFPRR